MADTNLHARLTLLVNSCDAYADLWVPFFTLLKKYWAPLDVRVLLNTESKDFCFDGLEIECVHLPGATPATPYGARMLYALGQIKTPYTAIILDDFFLRKPVDLPAVAALLDAMDTDSDIVYFNCDCTETASPQEIDRYPGYHRLPCGNLYTLNLQTALWRTDKLKSYWVPNVSPWEWEEYCNVLTLRHPADKFYCVKAPQYAFADYAYNKDGMGIFHGKWVESDVVPLFKKEGIPVDFTKRGFYTPAHTADYREPFAKKLKRYRRIVSLVGVRGMVDYFRRGRHK